MAETERREHRWRSDGAHVRRVGVHCLLVEPAVDRFDKGGVTPAQLVVGDAAAASEQVDAKLRRLEWGEALDVLEVLATLPRRPLEPFPGGAAPPPVPVE